MEQEANTNATAPFLLIQKPQEFIRLFEVHRRHINAKEYYSVVPCWVLYSILATSGYWLFRYAVTLFSR